VFRGYVRLNDTEIINSARVVTHLGIDVPTNDAVVWGNPADCSLTIVDGLAVLPDSSTVTGGLATPPDGSYRWDPGLLEVMDCWPPNNLCGTCDPRVGYDDSWPGLQAYLGDTVYRPELAPWYAAEIPESAEFGGIWLMKADGFDPAPVDRPVTELIGSGGSAGTHRDSSRKLTFTALLIACSNAGLAYGIEWLACQLRETKAVTDSVLRYFSGHPADTAADPGSLLRELHGVVLTKAPTIDDQFQPSNKPNRQATMYQVSWEMVALQPYAYMPPVTFDVTWDSVTPNTVRWLHAADCVKPDPCLDMPVLFSATCAPETVEVVPDPPPTCGGCMPVCEVQTWVFTLPTQTYPPLRCDETAVTVRITNTADYDDHLSLQAYWRVCSSLEECEDNRFPATISGLPGGVTAVLDGISGRYWAEQRSQKRRPVGIVSTPTGAPFRPAVIDRAVCWEFVVLAAADAQFTVTMSLADREA
jgi:hypothetical protein